MGNVSSDGLEGHAAGPDQNLPTEGVEQTHDEEIVGTVGGPEDAEVDADANQDTGKNPAAVDGDTSPATSPVPRERPPAAKVHKVPAAVPVPTTPPSCLCANQP